MPGQEAGDGISCVPFRRDRRELLPLFRLADDSERQIQSYLYRGEILVAAESGQALGHALIVQLETEGDFELKSIAVLDSRQGQGIGGMLLKATVRYCSMRNGRRLKVATSIADSNAIGFYLRHGFRASAIVRDAFTEEVGYPKYAGHGCIPLNDALELELVLNAALA